MSKIRFDKITDMAVNMRLFACLRYLVLLAFILSCREAVYADSAFDSKKLQIDSLEKALKTQTLTERRQLDIYCKITTEYASFDIDSTLVYAPKAIELAQKLKDKKLEAENYSHLGIAYCFRDNYDSAFICFDKIKELAAKTGDIHKSITVFTYMAFAYAQQGKYLSAIDFYTKALKAVDESGSNETKYIGTLVNLAELYRRLNNPEMAIQYLTRSEKLCNKIKSEIGRYNWNLTHVYNEYAFNYLEQNNLEKASEYALKSDSINQGSFIIDECQTKGLLATIYLQQNKLDSALLYAEESYKQADYLKDKNLYANAGKILSDIYLTQKRYPEAEAEALKVWTSDSTNIDESRNAALNIALANIYMNNAEKAAYYLKKYSEWNDSYSKKSFQTTVSDLAVKYQTEKKELQIASLEKQRILYIIIGVIAILLATVVGVVSRQKIRREQLKEQLIATNAILEWEEKERKRFASELHDGVNGMLSALKMEFGATESYRQSLYNKLDECIETVRRIAHGALPDSLERFGIKAAIEDHCRLFSNVHFHFFGEERRIEKKMETAIFFSACELVNNSVKHSGAKNINVQLIQSDKHVSLIVQDDGCGFNRDAVTQGAGLKNISDRVISCKGKMDIASFPGKGTETVIELKVEN